MARRPIHEREAVAALAVEGAQLVHVVREELHQQCRVNVADVVPGHADREARRHLGDAAVDEADRSARGTRARRAGDRGAARPSGRRRSRRCRFAEATGGDGAGEHAWTQCTPRASTPPQWWRPSAAWILAAAPFARPVTHRRNTVTATVTAASVLLPVTARAPEFFPPHVQQRSVAGPAPAVGAIRGPVVLSGRALAPAVLARSLLRGDRRRALRRAARPPALPRELRRRPPPAVDPTSAPSSRASPVASPAAAATSARPTASPPPAALTPA